MRDREGNDAQYKAPRAAFTLSDFQIIRNIGDGSFSTVVLAQLKGSGTTFDGTEGAAEGREGLHAIKIVNKHLVSVHDYCPCTRSAPQIVWECNGHTQCSRGAVREIRRTWYPELHLTSLSGLNFFDLPCPCHPWISTFPLHFPGDQILRNKMIDYIKNERIILDKLDYEGIVKLAFTFQDADSLCESMWGHHLSIGGLALMIQGY